MAKCKKCRHPRKKNPDLAAPRDARPSARKAKRDAMRAIKEQKRKQALEG